MSLLRAKPMRQKSDRAIARDRVLVKTKRQLLARAKGRCEVGGEMFGDNRIDHHHVLGRHGLGVWNDSAECGAVACREHHDYCQTHPLSEEQQRLERLAADRLYARLMAEGRVIAIDLTWTPRRRATVIVGALEALGVEP